VSSRHVLRSHVHRSRQGPRCSRSPRYRSLWSVRGQCSPRGHLASSLRKGVCVLPRTRNNTGVTIRGLAEDVAVACVCVIDHSVSETSESRSTRCSLACQPAASGGQCTTVHVESRTFKALTATYKKMRRWRSSAEGCLAHEAKQNRSRTTKQSPGFWAAASADRARSTRANTAKRAMTSERGAREGESTRTQTRGGRRTTSSSGAAAELHTEREDRGRKAAGPPRAPSRGTIESLVRSRSRSPSLAIACRSASRPLNVWQSRGGLGRRS